MHGEFSHAASSGAQVAQAQVALALARTDYQRRQQASGDGAVSGEELAHARDSVRAAEAALAAAQGGRDQTLSQIQGTDIANNPDVLSAEATLAQRRHRPGPYAHRRAGRRRGRPAHRAGGPAGGGRHAADGGGAARPMSGSTPISRKCSLQDMRVGQPVTVTADIYGGNVTYHGHVEGLGAGSGSAFALLPPQNASGNWIKIVQRVPVRIALDPQDLADHPLARRAFRRRQRLDQGHVRPAW